VGLLVTALAHLHVRNHTGKNNLEAGSTLDKKNGGAEKLSQQVINNSEVVQQ
jgi:hypothetical protein